MKQRLENELQSMQQQIQRDLQELIDSGEMGANDYHPRMKAHVVASHLPETMF